MKNDRFYVYFLGARIEVHASSERDAMILACAERIKEGLHCRITTVHNVDQATFHPIDLTKESPFEINWEPVDLAKCPCGEDH